VLRLLLPRVTPCSSHWPLQAFETLGFAPVGIICSIFCVAYMTIAAAYLLPKVEIGGKNLDSEATARHFICSFKLTPNSALVGQSVAASGLRKARDLKLVAIVNNGDYQRATDERVLMKGDV
jgi:Trk K+ transport system NAD-binding subunit